MSCIDHPKHQYQQLMEVCHNLRTQLSTEMEQRKNAERRYENLVTLLEGGTLDTVALDVQVTAKKLRVNQLVECSRAMLSHQL